MPYIRRALMRLLMLARENADLHGLRAWQWSYRRARKQMLSWVLLVIVIYNAVPAAYPRLTIRCVWLWFPHMKCHVSVRKQQFQYAWATKGWSTSLTQSSCVCVYVCVILGQPFPWNVLPPAKEKSLQWYAHITLQKHKDDLKRPESEKTGPVSSVWPMFLFFAAHICLLSSVLLCMNKYLQSWSEGPLPQSSYLYNL